MSEPTSGVHDVRVTVCETTHDPAKVGRCWDALREHTARHRPDIVLLPEFALLPPVWERPTSDPGVWRSLVDQADGWIARLPELGCEWVSGAFPRNDDAGHPRDEAFLWSRDAGYRTLRRKSYLPRERGFWEARWFEPAEPEFPAFSAGPLTFAVNICTELWALESVCGYPRLGVQAIMTPRATELATTDLWVALARTVAVRAGAFSISSNRRHDDGSCGGAGWIIDPEGVELARTSLAEPFVTRAIDLGRSSAAQSTYPRYIFAGD